MRTAVILAGIFVTAVSGCSTVGGWFGSSQTAIKPNDLPEIKPSMTLTRVWQESTGDMEEGALKPSMDGDGVFAASGNGVVERFQVQNGHEDWKTDLGKNISAGTATGGGLVLAGSLKGELFALDSMTGQKRWVSQLSSEVDGIPLVAGDIVAVRTGDGKIHGLSFVDGTRKWLFTRQLPLLSLQISKGLALKDDVIYAGFAGGKLVAINAKDGAQLWEASVAIPHGATELERVADVAGRPVVDAKRVCAVAYQGRVACFDRSNGTGIWNKDTSSDSGLAMDEQNVYVTDDKGAVTAYDKDTGRAIWRQDRLANRGVTAPLALGNVIVVGDFEGYVHVISTEDGSFVGRAQADGGAIRSAPVDIGPGIAVQTVKGTVTAFKLK
ncbi:MAG: outer membrane protein assembly factor BamB [Thiobacillaceae bacterium]